MNLVAHSLSSEGGDASEDGTGRGTPLVTAWTVHAEHSTAMQGNGDAQVAFPTELTRSLDTTGGYATNQGGTILQTQMAVRRLTPTECERLQGFPDGWTAGQNDSVRYRQLGNAVCVPVAEWIGRRMN